MPKSRSVILDICDFSQPAQSRSSSGRSWGPFRELDLNSCRGTYDSREGVRATGHRLGTTGAVPDTDGSSANSVSPAECTGLD